MNEEQLEKYLQENLSIKLDWDRGRLAVKLFLKNKLIDSDYMFGAHLASHLSPMISTRVKPRW